MTMGVTELLLVLGMAVAAGLVGCFTVMRKMTLAGASIGVASFMLRQRHRLIIASVSGDLARTSGVDVARLNLLFLLTFSVTVGLGLRDLGVLLMGSLIIIPAATAKHLTATLNSMLAVAVTIAVCATLSGILLAQSFQRETGPVIIAVAAAIFFVSVLKRRT